MVIDPLFQGVLFGTFIALGIGVEKARVTLRERAKKRRRRQSMGFAR
jgi:hypothetical protein